MDRAKIREIADQILPELAAGGWKNHLICGSYRRGRSQCKDLDVLVDGDYDATVQKVVSLGLEVIVGAKKPTKKHILRFMKGGLLIDLMFVDETQWGAASMHHTGPMELNIVQRTVAKQKRMSLNQFGLWKGTERVAGTTERGVYQALGLPYLEPEERESYAKKAVQV